MVNLCEVDGKLEFYTTSYAIQTRLFLIGIKVSAFCYRWIIALEMVLCKGKPETSSTRLCLGVFLPLIDSYDQFINSISCRQPTGWNQYLFRKSNKYSSSSCSTDHIARWQTLKVDQLTTAVWPTSLPAMRKFNSSNFNTLKRRPFKIIVPAAPSHHKMLATGL